MIASGVRDAIGAADPTAQGLRPTDAHAMHDAQRLAWQREMERAQSEAWFKHGAPRLGEFVAPHFVARVDADDELGIGSPAAIIAEGKAEVEDLGGAMPATNVLPEFDHGASSGATPAATGSDAPRTDSSGADDCSPRAAAGIGIGPADSAEPATLGWTAAASDRTGPLSDRSSASGLSNLASTAALPTEPLPAPAPAPMPSLSLANASTRPSLASATSNALVAELPTSTEEIPATSRSALPSSLREALDPARPLQLHVQWRGNEAEVWIGLSRAASAPLPQLLQQLSSSLGRNGFRLRSVVCNGVRCFESGAPLDEMADPGMPSGMPPQLDLHLTLTERKD